MLKVQSQRVSPARCDFLAVMTGKAAAMEATTAKAACMSKAAMITAKAAGAIAREAWTAIVWPAVATISVAGTGVVVVVDAVAAKAAVPRAVVVVVSVAATIGYDTGTERSKGDDRCEKEGRRKFYSVKVAIRFGMVQRSSC